MIQEIPYNRLKEIAKQYNLLVLVLFGSRADGTAKKTSDWDFAFYSFKEMDLKKVEDLKLDISKVISTTALDLIDLNRNFNVVLRKSIFFEGKCIYEFKEGIFEDFQDRIYFEYLDFKDQLDLKSEFLKKELSSI